MDKKALTAQMDPMELSNVDIEPDDESISGESIQDSYTGMGNLEKAAMSRYGVKMMGLHGKTRGLWTWKTKLLLGRTEFITYLRDNNDVDVNTSTL